MKEKPIDLYIDTLKLEQILLAHYNSTKKPTDSNLEYIHVKEMVGENNCRLLLKCEILYCSSSTA